ncbi:MAG: hypothetical protein IT256_08530 [Chitinophagaceae bacterium]|nr:hypothetical protein [Chitinophagaceae bacterium]
MTTTKIDQLNILLIVLSLWLAIKLPFELFLFSYAFLGPLHYLTEINWLKSKSFFVKKQEWIWLFLLLTIAISAPTILGLSLLSGLGAYAIVMDMKNWLTDNVGILILTSLLFAIGLVHFQQKRHIAIFFLASVFISFFILRYVPLSSIVVTIFIPTLVHIYLFTLLFMVFGTINNKSTPGIVAIALLIIVPFFIFNLNIHSADYVLSATTKTNYSNTNLDALNIYIARIMGASDSESLHLNTSLGIKIQILIAFCYTYHYLNWFSKTSIIGWNKAVPKSRLFIILALWLGSVLLYLYDYKVGLIALFFLSFLHIILEFPLNIVSIKGIYQKIANSKQG